MPGITPDDVRQWQLRSEGSEMGYYRSVINILQVSHFESRVVCHKEETTLDHWNRQKMIHEVEALLPRRR